MGTKNKTVTTGQFSPAAMSTYNALQPGILSNLQAYMQDPRTSGFANLALQQSLQAVNQMGARGAGNIMSNLRTQGFAGGSPSAFGQSMLAQQARATSGQQSNAYINNLLGFNALRLQATGMAGNYRPLQTGQTTVTSKSGLGTWLPQVAMIGLGMATGNPALIAGGASGFGGGSGSASPMGALNNNGPSMMPDFGTTLPPSAWNNQNRGGAGTLITNQWPQGPTNNPAPPGYVPSLLSSSPAPTTATPYGGGAFLPA